MNYKEINLRNCQLITTNRDKVVMVGPNVTMDRHQAVLQCAARLVARVDDDAFS